MALGTGPAIVIVIGLVLCTTLYSISCNNKPDTKQLEEVTNGIQDLKQMMAEQKNAHDASVRSFEQKLAALRSPPVPVTPPPATQPPQPKYKVALNALQRQQCAAAIAHLDGLNVNYAVSKTIHSFYLAVFAENDIVSHHMLHDGEWERGVVHPQLQALKSQTNTLCSSPPCHKNTMVDIGANVGFWTFTAAAMGYRVVALEASPLNIALLDLSLCLNPELAKKITLKHTLLSEKKGACIISFPKTNVGDGQMDCLKNGKEVAWTEEEIQEHRKTSNREIVFRVDTLPLTEVLDAVWASDLQMPSVISFLKIDVEGSEFLVLKSGQKWFANMRYIYSEVWSTIQGGGPAAYLEYVRNTGNFEVWKGECNRRMTPMSSTAIRAFEKTMSPIENVCFAKRAGSR